MLIARTSILSWIVTFPLLNFISFMLLHAYFYEFSFGKYKRTHLELNVHKLWSQYFSVLLNLCLCVCVYVVATGPVERVYLSAPIVAIRGKEANLTAVVWPSHTTTLTFFWWFDNSSEVRRFHSSSHYCPRTFCLVYCSLFHYPTLLLMSLCCCLQSENLQSFHTNRLKCDCTWLACVFLEDPNRMTYFQTGWSY